MVLIHGAGLDRSLWAPMRRALRRRGRTAIALDLPGHGREAGPSLPDIAAMARWVLARTAPLGPVVLAGHSMGALIALEAAATAPEGVAAAALLGAAASMPVNPDLLATAQQRPAEAAALIARWCFAKDHPNPAAQAATARRFARGAAALGPDLAACDSYRDGEARAAALRRPALVAIGEGDRMAPPAAGRALAEACRATPLVLPATGHMMMLERAEAVAAAIAGLA
ncbi:MAG TPA: alpha/beta fold hydrolase [Alphaproteobacteria bacterium]|nr:alpha/beta fold hydrolase [Alphaproteobacteria bacterium]